MRIGGLSRWESSLRLCIIGNEENRRVRDFQAAAMELGLPKPPCVSWLTIIDGDNSTLSRLATQFDLIRLESPGENEEVHRRLVSLGSGSDAVTLHGELAHLEAWHLGFSKLLDDVAMLPLSFQNSPANVLAMFDKWRSHLRFQTANLGRPKTELVPTDPSLFREFRQRFESRAGGHQGRSSGRVFLKPRYSSSASGICAYRWFGDQEQLIAPIEIDRSTVRPKLFNSLRIRKFTDLADINLILDRLLPEGMICEQWIGKARLPDGAFDLRILVIDGVARHLVVRQSSHPMTNLHLGNRRGSIDEVVSAFGESTIEAARQTAVNAASCFQDSLYVGVDVIIDQRGRCFVCEANAFGDLLPGLRHDGETTYEAILRASLKRFEERTQTERMVVS